MAKQLYFECSSGISGDMTVGAMLDLGADRAVLMQALDSLPLSGYTIEIGRRAVSGIDACDFDVVLDAPLDNHDHDMAYLYGSGHHDHGHHHDHSHDLTPIDFEGEVLYPEPICADDVLIEILESMIQDYL